MTWRSPRNLVASALTLSGLMPLVWLRDGLPTKGVDSFFSLHPAGFARYSLYAWDSRTSTGNLNADVSSYLLNLLTDIASRYGLSLHTGQVLVLCLLALSALFGMYSLLLELVPSSHLSELSFRSIAAAGALIWVVNPFALGFVYWHQLHIEVTWALLPWLLRVFVRICLSRSSLGSGCGQLLLLALIGSAGLPQVYLPGILLMCALLLVSCALTSQAVFPALRRGALAAAVLVLSLAWWLIPSLPETSKLNQAAQVETSSLSQFEYASQFSHVREVVSLSALPQLHISTAYSPYVSWSNLINAFPGNVLKYLLPALAFLGLTVVAERRFRRLVLLLGVGTFAAVVLTKGDNAPFAGINRAILNLPLGDAFRHPVDKFSFLLVPCLVVLATIGLVTCRLERGGKLVTWLLAGIVIFYMGSPWWTGSVIPRGGVGVPSSHVAVPASYDTVGEWLGRQRPGGKTQVEPFSYDGQEAFSWSSGIQSNLDPLLEDWAPARSLLARASGLPDADRVGEVIDAGISRKDPEVFGYARLTGVDSWVVHDDWRSDLFPPATTAAGANQFLGSRLAKIHGVNVAVKSADLTAYKSNALPVIYAAQSEYSLDKDAGASQWLDAASKTTLDNHPVVVQAAIPQNSHVDPAAALESGRATPTSQSGRLTVHGRTWLVFNQTFDPGWHLTVNGAAIGKNTVANTFANAWQVTGDGTYEFHLTYQPQHRYDLGFVAAILQSVIGLILVGRCSGAFRRRPRMQDDRAAERLS